MEHKYPTVVSHIPSSEEIDVDLIPEIQIEFSVDLNPKSLNYNTVLVYSQGDRIKGTIDYKDRVLYFTPFESLPIDQDIQITLVGKEESEDIQETIMDIIGNPLPVDYSFSFTTLSSPTLDAPHIISPSHQTIINDSSIVWEEIPKAQSYIVQICKDKIFDDILEEEKLDELVYQFKDLEFNQEYFVRVKASSEYNKSKWSEVISFYYEDSSFDNQNKSTQDNIVEDSSCVTLFNASDGGIISSELPYLMFSVNEEFNDVDISLQGKSINDIPYIQSHGYVGGDIVINGQTIIFTPESSFIENNQYEITVLLDGERYLFSLISDISPLYSSVKQVRQGMLKNYIKDHSDLDILYLINENSTLAEEKAKSADNEFDTNQVPFYVVKYVTEKTRYDLFLEIYLDLVSSSSRDIQLADFQVKSSSRNGLKDLLSILEGRYKKCEEELLGDTNKGRAKAAHVLKSENVPYPISNRGF